MKEIIERLRGLKIHCESMADPDYEDDVWSQDVEALEIAIKELEEKLC